MPDPWNTMDPGDPAVMLNALPASEGIDMEKHDIATALSKGAENKLL